MKKSHFAFFIPHFFSRQHTLNAATLRLFFQQLATLIHANLPLRDALHLISLNTDQRSLTHISLALKTHITAGNSFTASLRQFPHVFDRMTCQLIEAGEKTGTLDILLRRIAMHHEARTRQKKRLIQALFYPTITLIIATSITLIMLIFITPRFAELFLAMHAELPAFTRFIIAAGASLRQYFLIASLSILLLIALLLRFRHTKRLRALLDNFYLHCPIYGSMLRHIILARFTRTLATVFAAGIPLTEALALLAPTCGNLRYTAAIYTLQHHLNIGRQLHQAMQQNPLFPAFMCHMVQAGEASGTLETMLITCAENEELTVDHFISLMSQLLEPLIMLILGVLIGGLVIAMYLPIFRLGNVV